MNSLTEPRVCRNCGHLNNDYKPVCHCYWGPRSGDAILKPDTETCDEHEFEDEKLATGLLGSSVDCAKYAVPRLPKDVLMLALARESAGSNRRTLVKMIEVQLRKLERKSR
jgi:hypothetical protein